MIEVTSPQHQNGYGGSFPSMLRNADKVTTNVDILHYNIFIEFDEWMHRVSSVGDIGDYANEKISIVCIMNENKFKLFGLFPIICEQCYDDTEHHNVEFSVDYVKILDDNNWREWFLVGEDKERYYNEII